ncbi:hypothetical protein COU19_02025 [Candidatus Kaiserbacteria bacterium CG10_big_fil_rev_8_21_14_0_10_56_12]|uniref:Uncharacterized protein n=1 Tax=Candidatus Kaiserbacteria bacterium CG10_big_fil_rev_8_21_14_0_10_56_12 TaxID=1974611 RepID=A0A2H0U9X6_9BACT|nr:MAG: hypothetical protein COU19_02025 [Candidatus Kaiserbacteria bacterium CG10_big_fil_rev_8_21_14_0_10_56_12]
MSYTAEVPSRGTRSIPCVAPVNDHIVYAGIEDFDPRAFLADITFTMSNKFRRLVLAECRTISVPTLVGEAYTVVRDNLDDQVRASLGDHCTFESASHLCARMARLIQAHPTRMRDEILRICQVRNIFYLDKYAIYLYRLNSGEGWYLDAEGLVVGGQPIDSRVFSAG